MVYFTKLKCVNSTTSKGNQRKWTDGEIYIKEDSLGYEGVAECIVSEFLDCVHLPSWLSFVNYYECEIFDGTNKSVGCYSKNFLDAGEEIVPLYRVLKLSTDNIQKLLKGTVGRGLYEESCRLADIIECKYFDKYLSILLTLDALVLNEDRHLNNICFIKKGSSFRVAPIFDNGLSLLSDVDDYPLTVGLSGNIRKVNFKPFSVKCERQLSYVGVSRLRVDFNKLMYRLNNGYLNYYPPEYFNRAIGVLKTRLRKYEGILWEKI